MSVKAKPNADLAALLRARNPLLWIVTREEQRIEKQIVEIAKALDYLPRCWDAAAGITTFDGARDQWDSLDSRDAGYTLNVIKEQAEYGIRSVWIMRDLTPWITGPIGLQTSRQLRNLAKSLPECPRSNAQAIIIVTPSDQIPAELSVHATLINWPLPTREEIADALDASLDVLEPTVREKALSNGARDAAIDAAVGLTHDEAMNTFAKSLVQLRRIDPIAVAAEKRRVIARDGLLQWMEPLDGGLSQVGGLEHLKDWLDVRKSAFSPQARAYGLPTPRGVVLVGISGCGKTLMAMAIATAWSCPLIRFDPGALKSKFVGESEANVRKALETIAALGRCVVLIDEIEKALQGATSDSADGGVSSDALGAILSWMQDRQGEAFVVATSNDIERMPPELLRKGRFDDIFWVDLPTQLEREGVLAASLRKYGRGQVDIDLLSVAGATKDFTGAEIAAIVPDALYMAFNDSVREITTNDLLAAAKTIVPLAKTAEKRIAELRSWAIGKARPASKAEAQVQRMGRQLDIA